MLPRCRFALVSILVACFVVASTARGQVFAHPAKPDPDAQAAALKAQEAILASPRQFGTQCCQILQIPWSSFASPDPISYGYTSLGNGYIAPTGGGFTQLYASVTLPTGAGLDFLDLYYLDSDPSNDICASLIALTGPTYLGDPPSFNIIATTCSSGSPGYGYAPIAASGTINNDVYYSSGAAQYVVDVSVNIASSNLAFKAVDIWWHRQVSPAPGTATFNDVPTSHPFFQYVEALAASGITAGCQASPPLYCPDAALTRKQMAAFLSKGFGLYWPY